MRVKYLPQDNEARINNGICRFEGRPYLLGLVTQTEIMLSPIYRKEGPGSESIKVKADDPRLDISAPTLGYVNAARGVFYLNRRPERRYKQTLTSSGIFCYPIGTKYAADSDICYSVLHSNAGEKMFLDEYPSFDKAIEDLRGGKITAVALSKEVAIANPYVYIKNEMVGTLDLTTLKVKLVESEYMWITERYLSKYPWGLV